MTRILALDTSGAACSVALLQDEAIDQRFELAPRDHTRLIMPMVDDLLRQHALELSQLDAIAFGRGPGSFTGLRISAAVVQGLAFGADLPVLGVSSLAAIAQGMYDQSTAAAEALALVCMDARMGEIYYACYSRCGDGVALAEEEKLLRPEAMQFSPLFESGKTLALLGSGWQYRDLMSAFSRAELALPPALDVLPQARHIAQLASLKWQRGEYMTAEQVEPVYLREQVAWKKSGQTASGEQ